MVKGVDVVVEVPECWRGAWGPPSPVRVQSEAVEAATGESLIMLSHVEGEFKTETHLPNEANVFWAAIEAMTPAYRSGCKNRSQATWYVESEVRSVWPARHHCDACQKQLWGYWEDHLSVYQQHPSRGKALIVWSCSEECRRKVMGRLQKQYQRDEKRWAHEQRSLQKGRVALKALRAYQKTGNLEALRLQAEELRPGTSSRS